MASASKQLGRRHDNHPTLYCTVCCLGIELQRTGEMAAVFISGFAAVKAWRALASMRR
jgi:hypothetical protein